MNPEEFIPIKVDILLLKKYFDFHVFTKGGKPWEQWTIKRKYYDQVEGLLSEYGIQDQRLIDTLCHLESLCWGLHHTAKENDVKNEFDDWRPYYLDHSKFGKFIEEYNIKSIHFKGNSKTTGGGKIRSVTLNDPKFIEELLNDLSSLMERSEDLYNDGYGEKWKRKPGAEMKPSGRFIWNTFFRLRKFLHDLPFPKLNDLSETNENYFAGRFFTIAGIIEPLPEGGEDNTSYKSEKDYLVKRMLKHR